jgi:hypothetical protein
VTPELNNREELARAHLASRLESIRSMKKLKREPKKLSFHPETVRNLAQVHLAQVAGGAFSDVFCSHACPPTTM